MMGLGGAHGGCRRWRRGPIFVTHGPRPPCFAPLTQGAVGMEQAATSRVDTGATVAAQNTLGVHASQVASGVPHIRGGHGVFQEAPKHNKVAVEHQHARLGPNGPRGLTGPTPDDAVEPLHGVGVGHQVGGHCHGGPHEAGGHGVAGELATLHLHRHPTVQGAVPRGERARTIGRQVNEICLAEKG